jgi:hypothetical protein
MEKLTNKKNLSFIKLIFCTIHKFILVLLLFMLISPAAYSQNTNKTTNLNKVSNNTAQGISQKKIEITGEGLLLKKDKDYSTYSITQEEYNRYLITYDGDIGIHDILDVKKVIYNSDLDLLSDNLFYSIEISKLSATATRNGKVQRYGSFVFHIKVNIKNLNDTYTDKKTLNTLLLAITQVNEYIVSFEKFYQSKAYLIEPLLPSKVYIQDIEGRGASIDDVKAECDYAKKLLENKN